MKLINTLAFLLVIAVVQAQNLREVQIQEEPKSFKDLEYSFLEWSNGKELSDEKGWKWYKRWEEFYAQRLNGNGELVDPAVFLQEAVDANAKKKGKSAGTKSTWIPAGPDYKPPSPNQYSSHGVSRINCVEFHPTDPNTFWIGASQGGIWKTTNGGASWIPIADDLPILRISDIEVDPNDPDVIYACVGDFEYNGVSLELDDRKRHTHYGLGVYKTTDGGMNWSPTGLTVLQTDLDYSLLRRVIVDPSNSNNLVAVGFEGAWKSTDAGANWTNTLANEILTDLEISDANPSVLYAGSGHIGVLNDGTTGVFKSTDFGDTWNPLNVGVASTIGVRVDVALAPTNNSIVYALVVGQDDGFYALYRSTDDGANWAEQSNGSSGPNILEWSDGFNSGGQGSYDLGFLVDPTDPNVLHVGGVNMWGSDDGGVTWDGESYWLPFYGPSVHADQHQFKYNALDDKFYVCNDGGIYRTDSIIIGSWFDANNTGGYQWPTVWEDLSDGMQITSFYRLSVNGANQLAVIAGAQDNSTFYFDGVDWINVIGGDGMECVLNPNNPDMFWGSSQYGNLSRTTNGGATFNGISNTMTGSENGAWTTPFIYSPLNWTMYAGYGNVWKSINNGSVWNPISNFNNMPGAGVPAPASAVVNSKNNPSSIYVAKRIYHSYGQLSEVHVTHDEGSNWTNITAGLPDTLFFTYMAVDDDDPNLAWITCGGFEDGVKVFKTTNGGMNWTNISGTLPNIPVNTIALDETSPDHILYLGTDLGVYTTDDNASDWTLYGNNLPNVIVSELEISYATGELFAATFGRGIWKTGLPLSFDQNDSGLTELDVYPNPAAEELNIDFYNASSENSDLTIEVVDIKGSKVIEYSTTLQAGPNTIQLDLNVLSGVYFVILKTKEGGEVIKFIKE